MSDSCCFESSEGRFDLLLEVETLKSLLPVATSLGCLFGANVEVEDEVRLDEPTVRTQTPVEVQSLNQARHR